MFLFTHFVRADRRTYFFVGFRYIFRITCESVQPTICAFYNVIAPTKIVCVTNDQMRDVFQFNSQDIENLSAYIIAVNITLFQITFRQVFDVVNHGQELVLIRLPYNL